jgi:hypothetical protein
VRSKNIGEKVGFNLGFLREEYCKRGGKTKHYFLDVSMIELHLDFVISLFINIFLAH